MEISHASGKYIRVRDGGKNVPTTREILLYGSLRRVTPN